MVYDARAQFADDWQNIPDVVEARYEFGDEREFEGTAPTEPTSGVRVRLANPTQNEIAVAAATVGYKTTDRVLTVWAKTLSSTYAFEPQPQDVIVLLDGDDEDLSRWMVGSVKRTVFGAQFVCYCSASPLNENG